MNAKTRRPQAPRIGREMWRSWPMPAAQLWRAGLFVHEVDAIAQPPQSSRFQAGGRTRPDEPTVVGPRNLNETRETAGNREIEGPTTPTVIGQEAPPREPPGAHGWREHRCGAGW